MEWRAVAAGTATGIALSLVLAFAAPRNLLLAWTAGGFAAGYLVGPRPGSDRTSAVRGGIYGVVSAVAGVCVVGGLAVLVWLVALFGGFGREAALGAANLLMAGGVAVAVLPVGLVVLLGAMIGLGALLTFAAAGGVLGGALAGD